MIYKEKQILELTESLVTVNKDDISISLKSNRKHKILQVMDGAPKKLVYTPDTQQYSFFKLVYYTQQLHKQLFNDSDIQSASGHYQKPECLKLWMFLPFFFFLEHRFAKSLEGKKNSNRESPFIIKNHLLRQLLVYFLILQICKHCPKMPGVPQ